MAQPWEAAQPTSADHTNLRVLSRVRDFGCSHCLCNYLTSTPCVCCVWEQETTMKQQKRNTVQYEKIILGRGAYRRFAR